MRRAGARACLVLVFLAGATACGDDGGGDPLDVPPNEFVPPSFTGDPDSAFCQQYPRLDALAGALTASADPDTIRSSVVAVDDAVDDLATLAPDELDGDMAELRRFVDGLSAALRSVGYDPAVLTRNETQAFTGDRALVAQLRLAAYADQVCGLG